MATGADRKRREERVKLGAAALANIGTAFLVGGAIGPALLGRLNPVGLVVSVTLGLCFHAAAQLFLHYIVEDVREEAGS